MKRKGGGSEREIPGYLDRSPKLIAWTLTRMYVRIHSMNRFLRSSKHGVYFNSDWWMFLILVYVYT